MRLFRIKSIVLICCGALLLSVSCSNKYEFDTVLSQKDGCVEQLSRVGGVCEEEVRVKQLIASLGYDTTTVSDEGEYYLVDNKYRFRKDDVLEKLTQGYSPINTRMSTSGNDT